MLALLLVASVSLSSCSLLPCSDRRHQSGLTLVCADDIEPWSQASERLIDAFSFARELAEAHPELFGYPAPDFKRGELVLRVVRSDANALARAWIASGLEISRPKENRLLRPPAVNVRLEPATRSVQTLMAIQHDIGPNLAGLPDSDLIYQSGPDHFRNATRFVIERESDALLNALAARYGPDALVVEIDPDRPKFIN